MKTSFDLKQKRNAVELDIQALYETLQEEINEQKDMRDFNFAHIFLLCSVNWNLETSYSKTKLPMDFSPVTHSPR